MGAYDGYIGVFDSGLGGISVLQHLMRELPRERFVFFGDSANAPYGDKTREEVQALSKRIVDAMIGNGAKAIVIACNTATSAAAPMLRAAYPQVPIIGVEPALKPATEAFPHGRIAVMATRVTLRLDKFRKLARTYGANSHIIPLACPGLADLVETGDLDGDEMRRYLERLLGPLRGNVDGIVLGCTHYPFIKKQIREAVGDVPFYDGGAGTARQCRRLLERSGLLAPQGQEGGLVLRSSRATPEQIALYERFTRLPV